MHDGHPATLSWIDGVQGHRVAALGVEHFGQTGTIFDLYRNFEIDTEATLTTANEVPQGLSLRYAPIAAE